MKGKSSLIATQKSSPVSVWTLSILAPLALAAVLGALLQGCADCTEYKSADGTYSKQLFFYGSEGSHRCPDNAKGIEDLDQCVCAGNELDSAFSGITDMDNRPKGCYRYGFAGITWNEHPSGGSSSGARPICMKIPAPAPTPPAPTPGPTASPAKTQSSCCEKLAGGRRLDGSLCTEEECNR
eukprot:TRINITY_DN39039_c0_g1_i1.p1 TRINITY_DN39039_c0_g1~~TRINITY_DN39039_c0_g1_i1.p1  ORF type:complete len:182 (+),score=6.18 TRINITY_DN39039_c0_g1_i1:78-623(+)